MVRVGVVDSGIDPRRVRSVIVVRYDHLGSPENPRDRLGHGSAVAGVIAAADRAIGLLDARVFTDRLRCSAAEVAEAIAWCVDQRVRIINLSIGLRIERAVLRAACHDASARGVLLVASSPAAGAEVWPAAYPGVVKATGDARCAAGEISRLATDQADFGGCVHAAGGVAGASIGCASVTAVLAALCMRYPGINNTQLLNAAAAVASYHGPERRAAAGTVTE